MCDQRKDDIPTGELNASVECRFVYKTADALTLAFSLVEATSENGVAICGDLGLRPCRVQWRHLGTKWTNMNPDGGPETGGTS